MPNSRLARLPSLENIKQGGVRLVGRPARAPANEQTDERVGATS
jgi:hypothetical protein